MLILFLEYFKDRERQISTALFYINLQLFLLTEVPASPSESVQSY